SLGLTQPTIGEQGHALEREFNEQLVETHGRGCRLTEAGALLARLAGPLGAGIDSLRSRFEERRDQQRARITVVSSPRTLAEDILDSLPKFESRFPEAHVTCMEVRVENVADAVKSGKAHLGLTLAAMVDVESPWIEVEPGYELDLLLVTPQNHPLARRRRVSLSDIAEYPVVNGSNQIGDP